MTIYLIKKEFALVFLTKSIQNQVFWHFHEISFWPVKNQAHAATNWQSHIQNTYHSIPKKPVLIL